MTFEEKRKAIDDYCCSKRNCTIDQNYPCPLYGFSDCIPSDEEQLNERFVLVSNMPDYKGQKEKVPDPKAAPVNITIHAAICDELKDLYLRKNTDYGDSFHKTFIEEGMAMSRIRLSDKLERFKRLTRSGEQNVKDESVRDTLIDLANYAIMTIVEMERVKND